MKKVISIILAIMCFTLLGCTDNSKTESKVNSDDSDLSRPKMEKYIIEISMDNYLNYIEVSSSTNYSQTSYTFKGCLSYAFYDNVIVEFEYYTNQYYPTDENKGKGQLALNAAGNGTYSGGGKYQNKISGISGTVIYWI